MRACVLVYECVGTLSMGTYCVRVVSGGVRGGACAVACGVRGWCDD